MMKHERIYEESFANPLGLIDNYGSSLWTLAMLAEISHKKGWTSHRVHIDTVSQTLAEMGISWKRAKYWIRSPDTALRA